MQPTLEQIEQRLASEKVVVIDEETSGLSWQKDHTIGHVLAFGPAPDDSVYLPIRHTGGENLDPDKVNGAIRAGLKRNPTIRLANHNLAFDLKFMHKEGLPHTLFGALECTQVNACVIDERLASFSLAACCTDMKVAAKKGDALYAHLANLFGGEPTRDQMANFHRLPGDDEMAIEYATGDGISTWQLWAEQQKAIDFQELRQAWAIECRVIRVLHRITLRGVKINAERAERVREIVRDAAKKAEASLPSWLNPRSNKDMIRFFTEHGVTDWPTTPKGNASFAKEWLETNEPGKRIIASKQFSNLDSSFLTPMLERHLYKGRVHTNFNQTRGEEYGTITYRLSSDTPNLQQVHKRNDLLGSLYRSIFVPDDGMLMGTADYAQIEPCLLAHYGEVKVLVDGYTATPPIDAHSSVARVVFGSEFSKDQRESAKRINQALLTGAGRDKIALMVGKPRAEAFKMIDDYFDAMPEIKDVQKKSARVMSQRGYVKCLLGHRARLEDQRFAYKALNRLLQVGNAGIIKKAMADIDEYYASEGDRVHMLLSIHDDLVTQWHPDDHKIYERGLEMMTDFGPGKTVHVDVPIRVDAHEGSNWAEATYGVDKVRANWQKLGAQYK